MGARQQIPLWCDPVGVRKVQGKILRHHRPWMVVIENPDSLKPRHTEGVEFVWEQLQQNRRKLDHIFVCCKKTSRLAADYKWRTAPPACRAPILDYFRFKVDPLWKSCPKYYHEVETGPKTAEYRLYYSFNLSQDSRDESATISCTCLTFLSECCIQGSPGQILVMEVVLIRLQHLRDIVIKSPAPAAPQVLTIARKIHTSG